MKIWKNGALAMQHESFIMDNCDFSLKHDNFNMQTWGSAMTHEDFTMQKSASSVRLNQARQVAQAAEYWQALQDSSAHESYRLFGSWG